MTSTARTLYAVAIPVVIAMAFVFTTLAFDLTQGWPWQRMPGWSILALNVLPPLIAGGLTAALVIRTAIRKRAYVATVRAHAARLAFTYALCTPMIAVVAADWTSGDFWLWGQLILWPLVALVGLAATDLAVTLAMKPVTVGSVE